MTSRAKTGKRTNEPLSVIDQPDISFPLDPSALPQHDENDNFSRHTDAGKEHTYTGVAERFMAKGRRRNHYYYSLLAKTFSYNIPEGSSVLELGCGWGDLLAAVKPKRGVGIDNNGKMIEAALQAHPDLTFIQGDVQTYPFDEQFDFIIISDLLSATDDIWKLFRNLRAACTPQTRIIISQYNYLWHPVLRFAEKLRLKQRGIYDHWLSVPDIEDFLRLNGFEMVSANKEVLSPIYVPFVSTTLNTYISQLPWIRALSLVLTIVAKPKMETPKPERSVSIIIPTRNELGNIRGAIERTPRLGEDTEIIFVDGSSTDGTIEEINKYIEKYRGTKNISLIHQVSKEHADHSGKMLKLGKGDAVRKGFGAAKNDILMILDSDLTVPPEDLEKFYFAIQEGHCDFANGSRLVYKMEPGAMRFLNVLANYLFGRVFTFLLGQRIKDTLCGTKCLSREAYDQIVDNRKFFGDFDPFGDFDLLFGAAKLHLRIIDIPIKYRERVYGDIKIQRFKHGFLLMRMCGYAFVKMKLRK